MESSYSKKGEKKAITEMVLSQISILSQKENKCGLLSLISRASENTES